jgi:hypothetical protein
MHMHCLNLVPLIHSFFFSNKYDLVFVVNVKIYYFDQVYKKNQNLIFNMEAMGITSIKLVCPD